MKKQAGPSASELYRIEELREFIDSVEHSVIGEWSLGGGLGVFLCVCVWDRILQW